jgi:apolipoprotein N-acyltransferase
MAFWVYLQEVAKRAWCFMGVVFVLLFFWLGAIIIVFSEAP